MISEKASEQAGRKAIISTICIINNAGHSTQHAWSSHKLRRAGVLGTNMTDIYYNILHR